MILYWDFILTFPQEVERYWGRKFRVSWTTTSFFACRYLSLLGHIPDFIETAVLTNNESVRRIVLHLPKFMH